jgi:hypothetical protein
VPSQVPSGSLHTLTVQRSAVWHTTGGLEQPSAGLQLSVVQARPSLQSTGGFGAAWHRHSVVLGTTSIVHLLPSSQSVPQFVRHEPTRSPWAWWAGKALVLMVRVCQLPGLPGGMWQMSILAAWAAPVQASSRAKNRVRWTFICFSYLSAFQEMPPPAMGDRRIEFPFSMETPD